MTFEKWWATLTTREQARMVKEDVLEAWNTSQASEREACAKLCESMNGERNGDCAEAIRARSDK
jgi:hypothetical protein